ncbi:unnamed protein product [Rotaria magnacalcarata]|uniref:Uncharacterized protein n=3 Tax=Rotaria magnacalcarata TaxID=392030 RepID=A0A815UHU4_9BILA|nr:unnamed protein product [Rotaria magnacalcarata]CAF2117008.1 unnamed protein product [Rotaria magnacalcarata]
MNSNSQILDLDPFVSYYQNSLCNLQTTNNELLREILQKNHSSAFYMDRKILCLPTHDLSSGESFYASIDEFREKIPLTTYKDYMDYIDRMVVEGENNVLSSENPVYFSMTSGTTAKIKLLPATATTIKKLNESVALGFYIIRRSFPSSSFSSFNQRVFVLQTGIKPNMFPVSKDGIPMGPISNHSSAIGSLSRTFSSVPVNHTLSLDIIVEITDFETSAFVQLVFALVNWNIYSYRVTFASGFIHTVNIIENYFEEISLCISTYNFKYSSLVQKNISDPAFISTLNQKLHEVIVEYGGETYGLERAKHIRNECSKKKVPGILHRLWPNLMFATTAIGSTFTIYKPDIQFYCGDRLPLINLTIYGSSEGFFGSLASIHTDEYFLLPTHAFFEFIKEEDIEQTQPKTLLVSEIEPGHRYEVVCTTDAGLVRYRMGDVVNCTRFLCRTDDLVPLPTEPVEIPRVPLVSLAYRAGSLLDAFGEKTNEIHLMNALQQTIHQWKNQGIPVDFCDFTSYPKLDVFPMKYVIFLELSEDQECKIDARQLQILKTTANEEVDRQLGKANEVYQKVRQFNILDPLDCILVRSGTFSIFLRKFLWTNRSSPVQIKPHRLLKNEEHIRYFYDHKIDTSLS